MCTWPNPGNVTETNVVSGISRMIQGEVAKILKSSFSLWLLWCQQPFPSSCWRKCKRESIHYTQARNWPSVQKSNELTTCSEARVFCSFGSTWIWLAFWEQTKLVRGLLSFVYFYDIGTSDFTQRMNFHCVAKTQCFFKDVCLSKNIDFIWKNKEDHN